MNQNNNQKLIDLTESEYNGIPLNLHDVILNHVKKEENRWFDNKKVEIPTYKKPTVIDDKPGWYVFFLKALLP